MKKLRLILGDQLNINHSWYKNDDKDTLYFMAEMYDEATYTNHHIQKLTAFFMAMRAFAKQLESLGKNVLYFQIDNPENKQGIDKNVIYLVEKFKIEQFEYQQADEFRVDNILINLANALKIKTLEYDSEHFFTSRKYIVEILGDKPSYLMESFYRKLRVKFNILMDSGVPIGGKWNYDSENRKSIPNNEKVIEPLVFEHNVHEIVNQIQIAKIKYIGNINAKKFIWAITRQECLDLLYFFCENLLNKFGMYQDTMHQKYWSLYHSRISFGLNVKLISPKEVIDIALDYFNRNDNINLAQIEGFIRQILGWREYVRNIYWKFGENYKETNYFNLHRDLPDFYWTANTNMNCMNKAIGQSLDYSYAHHIQRLMITGNFALLFGVNPNFVEDWYLGIYIDAIEWVECPNTRGMSQYADGGIMATKPYISSSNYINKMSNYCSNCSYDKNKRYGKNACPFNSLYWNFIDINMDKLKKNIRMSIPISNYNKMTNDEKQNIRAQAQKYLDNPGIL